MTLSFNSIRSLKKFISHNSKLNSINKNQLSAISMGISTKIFIDVIVKFFKADNFSLSLSLNLKDKFFKLDKIKIEIRHLAEVIEFFSSQDVF